MRTLSSMPYLKSLSLDAEMRVTRSLERTRLGFSKDLVTPLVPDRNNPTSGRKLRIAEFAEFLYPTGYSWLDELELDRQEKIGPYSIMLPYSMRVEQVGSYFQQKDIIVDVEAFDYASDQVSRLVPQTLHAVSAEAAFRDMPRGTNLGFPFFSSDYSEYGQATLELAREALRGFRLEIPPCLLYWRGQPRGLEEIPKQRTVWGYPHWITILELMLQIPMLHALRRRIEFAAWVGARAVDEGVTTLLDTSGYDVLSIDFSGFDASVSRVLIERVFDIIRGWFSSREVYLINFVEKAFLEIGLWTPNGVQVDRNGGVPSGSGLTNLIDSLVQLLAINYFAYLTRNRVEIALVQGDDGVYSFEEQWSLDQTHEILNSLGLNASSDKGGVSTNTVYYLQNVHSKEFRKDGVCVGIRPLMKVLNGMLSYERFHTKWDSADDTIRWRQQLQAASRHPSFTKAVRWLYDNDRLSIFTLKELVRKAGGKGKVESALEMQGFPFGKPSLAEMQVGPVERELNSIREEQRNPTARR